MDRTSRRAMQAGTGVLVLASTSVVAAALGWATLIVFARSTSESLFASFAVTWSVYFGMAGLLAGLQHEVTRDLRNSAPATSLGTWIEAFRIGVPVSALSATVVTAFEIIDGATWWVDWCSLMIAFVGLTGLVTVLGHLSFEKSWWLMAGLLTLDAVLRFACVLAVVSFGSPSWAFGLALGLPSWVFVFMSSRCRRLTARRRKADRSPSAPARAFARKAAVVMASTGLSASMMAGLPWLVSVTAWGEREAASGGLLAALVLFRSPVLAISNGIRPVLLRSLLTMPEEATRATVAKWWRVCAALGVVLVASAALLGTLALGAVYGAQFQVSSWSAAWLAVSAVFLVMATQGTLGLVARDLHRASLRCWIWGVVATAVPLLLLPGADDRLLIASVAGPLVVVLLLSLALRRRAAVPGRFMRE